MGTNKRLRDSEVQITLKGYVKLALAVTENQKVGFRQLPKQKFELLSTISHLFWNDINKQNSHGHPEDLRTHTLSSLSLSLSLIL